MFYSRFMLFSSIFGITQKKGCFVKIKKISFNVCKGQHKAKLGYRYACHCIERGGGGGF